MIGLVLGTAYVSSAHGQISVSPTVELPTIFVAAAGVAPPVADASTAGDGLSVAVSPFRASADRAGRNLGHGHYRAKPEGETAANGARFTDATALGYTVVNVATNYRGDDHATLFGRIDNLFNEQYEDPTGFLRPDIALFTGVKFTD